MMRFTELTELQRHESIHISLIIFRYLATVKLILGRQSFTQTSVTCYTSIELALLYDWENIMEVMFNKCLYLVDLSYVNEILTTTINYFSKDTRFVQTDTLFSVV